MSELKPTYSRQEMYDLVWSTPIQKLAEQFGLSDRGLAKTCLRHQVPVPGRGYWARIEAGQSANRTPLPKLDNPGLEPVHIGAFKREVNPYVAYALRQVKTTVHQSKEGPVERPPIGEVAVDSDGIERSKSKSPPLQSTARPHPSVEDLAKELRVHKPGHDGYINVRWIHIHRDSIARVVGFLNQLAAAFEPYGIEFSAAGSRVTFKEGPTKVDFEITSPKKRILTPTKYGWNQQEYVPIGRLAFRIFGRAEGIKRNWVDKDEKQIESSVSQIVESYRVFLVTQKAEDERQRAENERRAELARRRDLAKQRIEREKARLKFLKRIAKTRREAESLRQTIKFVPDDDGTMPDILRMLEWARRRLAELDQITSPETIQGQLVEQNLFPDVDDLHDPLGEPPPKQGYWD